jgi:hypothetical protein
MYVMCTGWAAWVRDSIATINTPFGKGKTET